MVLTTLGAAAASIHCWSSDSLMEKGECTQTQAIAMSIKPHCRVLEEPCGKEIGSVTKHYMLKTEDS
jgi:hypothetical protein